MNINSIFISRPKWIEGCYAERHIIMMPNLHDSLKIGLFLNNTQLYVNILKFEGKVFGCLFVLEEQICHRKFF
jgi:hypothetical protein